MNRIEKNFVAFLLLGTSALFASDFTTDSGLDSEYPELVAEDGEVLVENPEIAFEELEIIVEESGSNTEDYCTPNQVFDYVDKYLVRLEKAVPSLVLIGKDFSYEYLITAKDKLKKVVIKDQIPEGAEYVSSSPTAQVDGNVITWTLYNLEKNEIIPLELTVNASTVADFTNSATIDAYAEAHTTTSVGVPALKVKNTAPHESVLIGSEVIWNVTIENIGNFCAENVVITDNLPSGLSRYDDGSDEIIEIGTIIPGDSREVSFKTLSIEPGKQCHIAIASASNAEASTGEACLKILDSGISISTEGPDMQFVGKKANYEVTVVNTGDVAFSDIIVTSKAPNEGKLVAAESATIDGNVATWFTDLDAGEEKSFNVDIILKKDGTHCNEVSFSTLDGSLSGSDSDCTEWRGFPALLIEVIDTRDPLIVGEETTYIIQIANQGTAADANVKLDIQIPEGLAVISVGGDSKGTITGNEIIFDPYPVLNPREIIQYRVVAKALEIGDFRFKAEMSSDLLKVPVPEQESTQAY